MPLVSEELELHVLAEIRLAGRNYTYGVWKALKHRNVPVETNLPTVLAVFKRLEDRGLVAFEQVPVPNTLTEATSMKRTRRYYRLTDRGEEVLRQKIRNTEDLIRRLNESMRKASSRKENEAAS
jgi:DNA-binding PadR family transcriptional regulator